MQRKRDLEGNKYLLFLALKRKSMFRHTFDISILFLVIDLVIGAISTKITVFFCLICVVKIIQLR